VNLLFRLLRVVIASWFKPKITDILSIQRINLRVWPNDVDMNMHMNNSRYLAIMDLGRVDLIVRSGLWGAMRRENAMPVLSTAQMRYRIPLNPLERYTLETSLVGWDDKWLYIEQRFIISKGRKAGAVAAIGLVKGVFYSRTTKETVPTQRLLDIIGAAQESPGLPPYITDWITADESLRDYVRAAPVVKDDRAD
tara:strand:+ start:12505 stop:13089 length:585 start_codon:yes stop_codon:yes gene_type:complete